jgi:cell division septation protein DedD
MSDNDNETDSPYELVVGNRQLLSAFFLIVILFGVFFALGYIVGRNSSPSQKALAEAGGPAARDDRPAAAVPPAARSTVSEAPVGRNPDQRGTITQPETKAAQQAAPGAEEPPVSAAAPAAEPGSGQVYLQVAAVKRQEADVVAEVLKKKGFPAHVGRGPTEDLFRVLVGPFRDASSLTKTRSDLEAAGFKSIVRK